MKRLEISRAGYQTSSMTDLQNTTQDTVDYAQENHRSSRESLARFFAISFFAVALVAWIVGAVGAQSELDNNWKLDGFTDSNINAEFQTAYDKGNCSNAGAGGCGRIQVVSKYDCSSVNGVATGNDDKGNVIETVNASSKDVTRGQSFMMEFDLGSTKSTHWNVTQLRCVRA